MADRTSAGTWLRDRKLQRYAESDQQQRGDRLAEPAAHQRPEADQGDDGGEIPPGTATDAEAVEQQDQPDGNDDQPDDNLPGIALHGSTSTRTAAADGSTTVSAMGGLACTPRSPAHNGASAALGALSHGARS